MSFHRRWPLRPADVVDGRENAATRRGNESVVLAARDSSDEDDGALGLQTGVFRRWPIPRISGLECREFSLIRLAAITLQSVNAPRHVLSCTLSAVRALYVVEYTFYDGFESHSLRHIFNGLEALHNSYITLGSRQLLASQVPCDFRHSVSVGRRRPSHGSAVAWSLGHGKHDAISEAIAEREGAREGK